MPICQKKATRGALRESCFAQQSHSDQPFGTITYPSTYAALKKEHPKWFSEETQQDDGRSHKHFEEIGASMKSVIGNIAEVRSQMRIALWLLVLIAGYLLLRNLL